MNRTMIAAVLVAMTLRGIPVHGAAADEHAHDAATKPSAATAGHEGHDHKDEPAHKDDHDHKEGDAHKAGDAHKDVPAHKDEPAHKEDHDHKDDGHAHKDGDAHKDVPAHKDDHAHKDGHDHKEGHAHGEAGHVDEVKLTAEAIRRHDIRVAPAKKQVLAATFAAPARVAYNAEAVAHVGSLVKGRAAELKASLGDVVKKGDELLVVESPELGEAQSDFIQKSTAVAIAAAAVEPAQRAAERAAKLYDKNQGIALAEVQKRESELKVAQGAVQTAQAALDAAKNKLSLMALDDTAIDVLTKTKQINARYVVRSPIAGTVVQREVTLGELVSPEKEALLVVADLSSVWVIADVPEAKLDDVSVGSAARVRVGASGGTLEGKLSYIAPSLDSGTRTAQVRIVVPNPKGALRPGTFARADLTTGATSADGGAAAPVLAVPEESVQTVEGKPAVFVPVEGEPNTFAARPVKHGRPVGGMVPIESGLKDGEQVVVNGAFILKADLGKAGAAHEH